MAGESLTDLGGAKDELLDDYLLSNEDDLDDEDSPTIEELIEMGRDGLRSDDNIPEGQF